MTIAGYLIYLLLGVSKWYSLLIGITLYYHWEIIYDIQVILKEEFRNAVILTRPVFLTLLYVSIFGYFFYKHIPRVLGGGSPSEQKIIVNSNAFSDNDYLKKLVAVNQQNVISVTVVLETNDEYFISLGDSSVLAFSKNLTVGKLNKVKNFEEYFN